MEYLQLKLRDLQRKEIAGYIVRARLPRFEDKEPSIQKYARMAKSHAKSTYISLLTDDTGQEMCTIPDLLENISESQIRKQVASLNKNKSTTFNNIPTRILVENSDIFSPFIADIYNNSKFKSEFPPTLKLADITPIYKKSDRTIGDNYRPVSILPPIS